MLKYMLDTNIVIYTIKNKPQEVREAFKRHDGQMCISTVTLGELIYGAERSTQPEKNMEVVEGMAARLEVLPFGSHDAAHFGQLRAELVSSGKTIGPYDMMIAGHARSNGLILVTNNGKEFNRVPGLRVENWVK
ncbi:MAG TPA: tRNA(fMet)-specific endonuclease VapC [Gammaproteobacteria bacterium]|nr:tRNA(fMet)-specific endonuclease VapC [Gammaproteobacteria bacterium]